MLDSIMKAAVVDIDRNKKQLTLSTRQSRMNPDGAKAIVDREITAFSDLKLGDTVRGFVKSVADHGLFVSIGRNVDARVQIKELFDEVLPLHLVQFSVPNHSLVCQGLAASLQG